MPRAISSPSEPVETAGIDTFALSMKQLKKIQVFQVNYVQSIGSSVQVVCQNSEGQLGEMQFKSSEPSQSTEGLLPIFEDVVDVGPYNKLKRKAPEDLCCC